MSAYLPAPLPRIPEPVSTVSRRQPTRLVAIPPGGNRQLSEDHLSSILTRGQRFDSGDQTPPQPMNGGDATAQREPNLAPPSSSPAPPVAAGAGDGECFSVLLSRPVWTDRL